MTHRAARTLFLSCLLGLAFSLVNGPGTGPGSRACNSLWASPDQPAAPRVVFLAGGFSGENAIALTANVAASNHPGVLLLDTPKTRPYQKAFLERHQTRKVIPIGSFQDGINDLERRLGMKAAPVVAWQNGPSPEFWQTFFPQADRVVVCPVQPRRLLLQAACLAGVLRAPLLVTHDQANETADLSRQLEQWHTRKVYAIGAAQRVCRALPKVQVVRLANEDAVAAAYLSRQLKKGPIRNLVLANPADHDKELTDMSSLAPWIALQRRAVLLFTNDAGDNVARVVESATKRPELNKADTLILVADLKAIPMENRPNPIAGGKDPLIEMEPLTPRGTEPFSYAIGRLFHDDPGVVVLMLARHRLLAAAQPPRKTLVVSNPGGSLPLLETFSQNTAKELANGGYQTTTLWGKDVNQQDLRRLLPSQDIFLWEGHYNTLVKEYCMHEWTEPIKPSLVFLQSCLALSESKAQPFLERGAFSIIGSSTRTYSGSGGACSLAFFDALLYEGQSLGGSLRQAKNFLLAYSLLKEKRLGKDAKLMGANVRSAWTFTLWGDPTLKLPVPEKTENTLAPVRHRVYGNTIEVALPDTAHSKAVTALYKAQMLPNQRLAGLLTKARDEGKQRLVPFLFAEVHLPKGPAGRTPRLSGRLPSNRWVFCWDGRRQCGYLLIEPRTKDRDAIRFHVDWNLEDDKVTR